MRWTRPRFTVRRALILVAAVAVALSVIREEFGDGLPPRWIIRDLPRRVERLRPGMTREQVKDVLGLDRSWLLGGLGPSGEVHCLGNSYARKEFHKIRDRGSFQFLGEGRPRPVSSLELNLVFRSDPKTQAWNNVEFPFLDWAEFLSNGRQVAEMPRSPRARP